MELSYNWLTHGGLMYSARAFFTVLKMAYERLDEALRQLKTDRKRAEATKNNEKRRTQKLGFGSRELSPG